METTREQKHHHRERRSMMHSANERAPRFFFFVMCSSVCQYTFLSHIFFVRIAYTARPKTKERATSFLFLHIYATKVIMRLFFIDECDKPDRKSLHQVTHGVKKQEKNGFDFTYNKIML
jgi:hypothetical protein